MIPYQISFRSKFPCVDGVYLRSKRDIVNEIFKLLELNGYHFQPVFRPIPPILSNWVFISVQSLTNYLHQIYDVFSLDKTPSFEVHNDYYVGTCGITSVDKKNDRFVFIDSVVPFTDVSSVVCVPLSEVGNYIDRVMYGEDSSSIVKCIVSNTL